MKKKVYRILRIVLFILLIFISVYQQFENATDSLQTIHFNNILMISGIVGLFFEVYKK